MIQLKDVTLMHKKDLRVILEHFCVVLNRGDKAVIIGEEGNGKSTLMKWIYSQEMVEDYIEATGEKILGQERLGYLPQELPISELDKTVYEYFSQKEVFWDQTPGDLSRYAKTFMVDVDIFYSNQALKTLSGGEKIKVQLMRVFMEKPTVLLLDEPSNDIDLKTLNLLEKLIQEWKEIVLFISHDEVFIENTANMVIHLEQIQRKTKSKYSVMKMSYRKYMANRLFLYERQEQQALNERKEKRLRDEKYRRVYQSVEHALKTCSRQSPGEAKNLKDKMHTVKAMGKRFEKEDEQMTRLPEKEEAIFFKLGDGNSVIPAGKTVIEYELEKLMTPAENNTVEQRMLSQHIFLRIKGAEKICIVGDNGVGKTTLLKKMAEELQRRTDIVVEYMPQDYEDSLDLSQTPVDFLSQFGTKEERTKIRTYLGALRYTADEMDHPMRELSGGEKAKVLLLKMSLSDANVLILDEPTRNFSPLSGPVIRKMLCDFRGAIISISHDRKYINEVCNRIYRLTSEGLFLQEKEEIKISG